MVMDAWVEINWKKLGAVDYSKACKLIDEQLLILKKDILKRAGFTGKPPDIRYKPEHLEMFMKKRGLNK